MDLGTILLYLGAGAIILDITLLLAGPRIRGYERSSLMLAVIGSLSAIVAMIWMAILIFTNNFQYEYVYSITEISSPWWLKISGIWAGQSGSLLFWTALSFILYLGFRLIVQGYEDDVIVYRASILMAIQSLFILANTLVSDPFRLISGAIPVDGAGMNPLLRTVWNAIHPPIIFIGYAMIMVPFAIKLAGFTVRSEERAAAIPVLDSYSKLMTGFAWAMLSMGIAIGGYWAYIVLGWGGYWAWDPVETSSLIPWLLLTAYYHGKAVLKDNEVIRDSILVFAYVTVLFATWVTRSGVLTSVHGFQLTLISWTMLATVLFGFILATLISVRAGYVELEDEEEEESSDWKSMFSLGNVRDVSIKVSLIGILIVAAVSVIGVALPAGINMASYFADPVNFGDNMVSVSIEFFRAGFYLGSFLGIVSVFYCMKTVMVGNKRKGFFIIVLLLIGGVLGILTLLFPGQALPTFYWPANALLPLGIGALAYLVIVFARTMAGKERGPFTMRRMGRLMLHLGLIFLLVGVFFSENVVYETNSGYQVDDVTEIAPGISIRVTDIDLVRWVDEHDFYFIVEVQIIENGILTGIGFATISGDPEWGSISHQVFVHSTGARDVFIAATGFQSVAPGIYQVSVHTKILPFISFVWLGTFLMMAAILPMIGIELSGMQNAIRNKDSHLYDEEETDVKEVEPIQE
ncbi:MAG: cytochrome c biogenesis protein CcsA [Candidatus Thorarchaeota archaeon]